MVGAVLLTILLVVAAGWLAPTEIAFDRLASHLVDELTETHFAGSRQIDRSVTSCVDNASLESWRAAWSFSPRTQRPANAVAAFMQSRYPEADVTATTSTTADVVRLTADGLAYEFVHWRITGDERFVLVAESVSCFEPGDTPP